VTRVHVDKQSWLAAMHADGAALHATLGEDGVLARPVPTCPGWTLGDLARHLGGFYHRIRMYAGVAGADEKWPPLNVPEAAPAADDPLVGTWFGEQLHAVQAHLESLDPDLPTWNWAPRPRLASFWIRRAAHETAVHRWDAQLSTRLPEPIESKLAADTVAEVLDTFLPAGRRRTEPAHGVVHLTAIDLDASWQVRLRGEAVSLLDSDTQVDESEQSRAEAAGSASDLALALWGRIPFDLLKISGDTQLLEAIMIH
jgi:uncharacterized protein (TIGR03083 family)